MPNVETAESTATVYVKNIGGIAQAEVDISPGVTVLEGRNATNRTSFLRAIMGVMGSNKVTLKGDAEEGRAELTANGETYTRVLRRTADGVALSGDPYLEDPTLADLFAFLLESNEARQAVAQKKDLRETIMRPVDTDRIQSKIDRLEQERDQVDEQLKELDGLKNKLPGLEERRTELKTNIEQKRAELTDKEAKIESMDAEIDETRAEKQELEDQLADLRDLRADLDDIRSEIELQEESIGSLRQERVELQEELAELPETPMGDHQHLEDEVARLRERKQTLETKMSNLQNVIQFNEEMLGDTDETTIDALDGTDETDSKLTDQLLSDTSITCWTCGSEIKRDRIEGTLNELQDVRQDYLDSISEVEADLKELREQQRERESQQQRREKLERRLNKTESELERRQGTLEELRGQRDQLSEEIETAEQEVEQLESEDFSAVLDIHKEANQIEFDLGRLESELDDITDRISNIEDRLAEESELRARRDRIQADLQDQRTRIDRLEQEAVERFNGHMDEVLEILEYNNLARIWIERVEKTVRQGRAKAEQTAFEIHVVRTTDANVTYEDTIDHLSESEREVTGLVFALAGYLVHEVHDQVPVMLLDSLEAIDSERIAELVDYFSTHVEYLIIALLPEDAQAIPTADTRITDI